MSFQIHQPRKRTGKRRLDRWENRKGMRYGRLVALEPYPASIKPSWVCKCDCGTVKVIDTCSLANGGTQSCGCLRRELHLARKTTHGLSKSPEYHTWVDLWQRCTNQKRWDYNHYGGRGITVCKRWERFEPFLKDMGFRPSKQHSIDRIKNHLGYSPSNCRWATKLEQSNNTRCTQFVEYKGKSMSIAAWARETGIYKYTLYHRIRKGWPLRIAMNPAKWYWKRGGK